MLNFTVSSVVKIPFLKLLFFFFIQERRDDRKLLSFKLIKSADHETSVKRVLTHSLLYQNLFLLAPQDPNFSYPDTFSLIYLIDSTSCCIDQYMLPVLFVILFNYYYFFSLKNKLSISWLMAALSESEMLTSRSIDTKANASIQLYQPHPMFAGH